MGQFKMFDKFIANLREKIEGMLDERRGDLFDFEMRDEVFDRIKSDSKRLLKPDTLQDKTKLLAERGLKSHFGEDYINSPEAYDFYMRLHVQGVFNSLIEMAKQQLKEEQDEENIDKK